MMKKFKSKTNTIFRIGLFIVIIMFLLALFSPILKPYDQNQADFYNVAKGISGKHIFGTDSLGRDILSRVLEGGKTSIFMAIQIVSISFLIGTFLGVISGYMGGVIDGTIMTIVNILISYPNLIFALALISVLGPSTQNAIIALCVVKWTRYARIARGEVLSLKNEIYIVAAKAIGNKRSRIMSNYIIPNIFSKLIVIATLDIGNTIMAYASLSFLGMGVQLPTPEWGSMINEGREFMRIAPHISLFPGIFLIITVLGFQLLGDGLRDMLDPKMRENASKE